MRRMDDMDELVAWTREQLDEDERACTIIVRGPRKLGKALAAHILLEIEAKRKILHEHRPVSPADGPKDSIVCCTCGPHGDDGAVWALEGENWTPCTTVKLLAQPYSDRPGYREEWRP